VPKAIPKKGQMQSIGGIPFENLSVDFTEMPQARGYKYLLVFVCTFSGCVEDFPTLTGKAQKVAKCLLKEVISGFGIPLSIGSDNGPPFMAKVV
jgi:transposase InsO family protein